MNKSNQVLTWDVATLSDAFAKKQVSPVEVTRQLLASIQAKNPELNAYITVMAEAALQQAKQAEDEIMRGSKRGPLHGVPIGLKDLIFTKGTKTTMGSEIYKDFVPEYDAAVVEKLQQAGAVIIGKLNTHQFAYGPTGDKSFFGPVKNPHNPAKITGGSSSGSGAAVAADLAFAALGTDTGGSIRIPAASCGVVGLKPTFGRVSKYGVYPLSWTLDHIGPMTKTVEDNALLLGILAGYDKRDPYSVLHADPALRGKEDFTRYLKQGIKGSVIGIPSSFYFEQIESEVYDKLQEAIGVLQELGAKIQSVEIPKLPETLRAHQITLKSEAYAIHKEQLAAHADQYIDEVRDRLLTGADIKAHEYVWAQQMKQFSSQAFTEVLEQVDVLLAPTIPMLPTDIGQREVTIDGVRKPVFATITSLTGPTDLNGFPSLSIPAGFSKSELPIGLQLTGKPFAEATLYRFGYAFEQEMR